jgi:hypothetical protein
VARLHRLSWDLLYRDFISQSDPNKVRAQLEALEAAIFERLCELDNSQTSQAERAAIRQACDRILEIKTKKLGFPAIFSERNACLRKAQCVESSYRLKLPGRPEWP